MSIRALEWALKYAPISTATEHLVLIGLADHAKEDGTAAWPSQARLADYARCSDRQVRRCLRSLEEAGTILRGDQRLVAHLPKHERPVVWDCNLGAIRSDCPPDKMSGGGGDPRTWMSAPPGPGCPAPQDTDVRTPRTSVSDKPSLNRPGTVRGTARGGDAPRLDAIGIVKDAGGAQLPPVVRDGLVDQAAELIDAGQLREDILGGVVDWMGKADARSPRLLPHLVAARVKRRTTAVDQPSRPRTKGDDVNAWLDSLKDPEPSIDYIDGEILSLPSTAPLAIGH